MPVGEIVYILKRHAGQRSLADVFHRLNNVIPDDQQLVTVTPNTRASDALKMMNDAGFSQLPVVEGDEVLGVFSYRSYCRGVQEMFKEQINPADMPVVEFIEVVKFARVTDEFQEIFGHLDRDDVVIAGEPNRIQGVVTAIDILKYLYQVARPFVLIAEIELALREMIRVAVSEDQLRECVQNSLSSIYEKAALPFELEEMVFNDYVQIVGDGRNWEHFSPIFLGDRKRTRGKLVAIRDLRNDVFHFKRELTVEEYDTLRGYRDWLLIKARSADARMRGAESG